MVAHYINASMATESTELDGGGILTALFQLCGRHFMFVCPFLKHCVHRQEGSALDNDGVGVEQAIVRFGVDNVLETAMIAGTDDSIGKQRMRTRIMNTGYWGT